MREIKFRAWCETKKVMFTPADNTSFVIHPDGMVETSTFGPIKPLLMQYTGLKDQNDVEIYESDLLKNKSGRICVVKWHEYAAMFDCEPVVIVKNDNAGGFKNNCWSRWIEVIGNIHQNPELLQANK